MAKEQFDYKEIGLVAGVEIHQQLEGKKLFCDTPTLIRDDEPDYIIKRQLRAVIGETGTVDVAAAAETAQKKTFLYQGYSDTIGLVECDEEPPHSLNTDALYTTLQLSKLLDARIVDEVQAMRKTVINGSNTSGFQRTCLVAMDGHFSLSNGNRVDVPTILLEEDACKEVSRSADEVVYNLSRLGIPLIEIGTGPQLHTPQEVMEACEILGMMLRSTGRVKRGLGTIRQDVNVSIKGGERVEIKGAQDLAQIPTLVDYEIKRQQQILALQDSFVAISQHELQGVDVTKYFLQTKCKFIYSAVHGKSIVLAIKLPNFATIMGTELQPGSRVGTDISDFLKVKHGLGGIIHSDEDLEQKYQFVSERSEVLSTLGCSGTDAFCLLVGDESRVGAAVASIQERFKLLSQGVPSEVRRANPTQNTSYMRPMPGKARMYPETDVAPIIAHSIDVTVPELIDVKIERFMGQYGLGEDLATKIAKSVHADDFEYLVSKNKNIKSAWIAETMIGTVTKIMREKEQTRQPTLDEFLYLFAAIDSGEITLTNATLVLEDIMTDLFDVKESIIRNKTMSQSDVIKIIAEVKQEFPDGKMGLLMAQVMKRTSGRADGKLVSELLHE